MLFTKEQNNVPASSHVMMLQTVHSPFCFVARAGQAIRAKAERWIGKHPLKYAAQVGKYWNSFVHTLSFTFASVFMLLFKEQSLHLTIGKEIQSPKKKKAIKLEIKPCNMTDLEVHIDLLFQHNCYCILQAFHLSGKTCLTFKEPSSFPPKKLNTSKSVFLNCLVTSVKS